MKIRETSRKKKSHQFPKNRDDGLYVPLRPGFQDLRSGQSHRVIFPSQDCWQFSWILSFIINYIPLRQRWRETDRTLKTEGRLGCTSDKWRQENKKDSQSWGPVEKPSVKLCKLNTNSSLYNSKCLHLWLWKQHTALYKDSRGEHLPYVASPRSKSTFISSFFLKSQSRAAPGSQ